MSITLNQIRDRFLKHMEKNSHMVISSSSLVPENDPTTLFTGSGMQPMLPYLLGQPHPLGDRIADSQKCFRSQDIEEVGDNRHTTFFEMLGNWSLGDFFKEGQIDIMWDFLIMELKLDPSRLYFSVYRGNADLRIGRDDVSISKWQEKFRSVGIEAKVGEVPEIDGMREGERIFTYPDKKNWWSRSGVPANMPEGEPGGPDTEMFFDFDPANTMQIHENSQWSADKCHVNCDCGRYVEIGNNVFMQFIKRNDKFEELYQKNVDFGGGLERMAAAVNDDSDVFMLDLFDGPKKILENISGTSYVSDKNVTFTDLTHPTFAYRVILDHIRAATFLIADGVVPGNKDQMYFVRRLIRRAVRFARNLNINTNFTSIVAGEFINYYMNTYANLHERRDIILSELDKEESKFRKTLVEGLKQFEKVSHKNITGEEAFDLLQSYGFPVELTVELAKERGLLVDMDEFMRLKIAHAESSRQASAGKFKGGLGGDSEMEVKYHTATHIMHQALKTVLGESVAQKGSNITPERLRFDFAFERKVTPEEIKQVEDIVNDVIKADYAMIREEVSYDEARRRGAVGLFDDKYGDKVSIYHMGTNSTGKSRGDEGLFSIEFCGGPHVTHTGGMGVFKITKEEAVSAGVRRIKAVLL